MFSSRFQRYKTLIFRFFSLNGVFPNQGRILICFSHDNSSFYLQIYALFLVHFLTKFTSGDQDSHYIWCSESFLKPISVVPSVTPSRNTLSTSPIDTMRKNKTFLNGNEVYGVMSLFYHFRNKLYPDHIMKECLRAFLMEGVRVECTESLLQHVPEICGAKCYLQFFMLTREWSSYVKNWVVRIFGANYYFCCCVYNKSCF